MDAIQSFPTVTRQGCTISFFSVVVTEGLRRCSVAGHRNGLADTGADEDDLYSSPNHTSYLQGIAIFVVRLKLFTKFI